MPRLEYDAKGKAVGAQKGGKGRKLLGGVIAIKNSWNNTLISISKVLRLEQTSPNSKKKTYADTYKQIGFVSGGTVGFKKSKRSSQFSTEKAISEAFAQAYEALDWPHAVSRGGPTVPAATPLTATDPWPAAVTGAEPVPARHLSKKARRRQRRAARRARRR